MMSVPLALAILAVCTLAHVTMVTPKWNYGTADTSTCDDTYSSAAGKIDSSNVVHGPEAKLVLKDEAVQACGWKRHRQAHWFNQGTQIGCPEVVGLACGIPHATEPALAAPCCDQPMEPTLTAPELMSFTNDKHLASDSSYRYNPWFAPGHAPVLDPCGIVGGYKWSTPELYYGGPKAVGSDEPAPDTILINAAAAPEGMQFPAGTFGSTIFHDTLQGTAKPEDEQPVAKWVAGGEAEVAQGGMYANHGGGYQWRLCPAEQFTADGVANEACFQSTPLEYASSKSQIRFGAGNGTWEEYASGAKAGGDASRAVEFDAVRVTDDNTGGVMPRGSTWTQLPVPNCGPGQENFLCEQPSYLGSQPLNLNFPTAADGAYGYGYSRDERTVVLKSNAKAVLKKLAQVDKHYDFTVVDKVKVPTRTGRYVLSWRWDCEDTAQVWTNCALVDIEAPAAARGRSLRGRSQPHQLTA